MSLYRFTWRAVTNITRVAIGCAVTGRHVRLRRSLPVVIEREFMFFSQLLSSFCQTASPGFDYHFYLAYDNNDLFYSKQESRARFRTVFERADCGRDYFNVTLHFVRCSHDGRPAWAQNDAMMEAYLDDMDYYYRVNDDTRLATPNWTTELIDALRQYDPPNLGVVGPKIRQGKQGDTHI